MNRRQVLQALAALPIASAVNSCAKERELEPGVTPAPELHPVEVHLDGAFSLVIQRHKGNSVLAFSVKDPKEPHRFLTYAPNREPELDATKSYHFSLSAEGLEPNARPEIKSGLEDFTAETENWRLGNNLVVLELPCPQTITFGGHREMVEFASGRRGWMPKNHILKYKAKDLGKVKLLCKELEGHCESSPDSPPGSARFFFEVGPLQGRDPKHQHAVQYFNYMLETSFPDLKEKFKLVSIGKETREKRSDAGSPALIPAVMSSDAIRPQFELVSYTMDCDYGGVLATTGSGPRP